MFEKGGPSARRFRGTLNGKREVGMEDLLLAFVTLAASSYNLIHLAGAGMDAFVIVTFLLSFTCCWLSGLWRGRSQWRWVYVAVIIGPLAIPMLYFVAAKTVRRRKMDFVIDPAP
jgi:hypothetical protein